MPYKGTERQETARRELAVEQRASAPEAGVQRRTGHLAASRKGAATQALIERWAIALEAFVKRKITDKQ